MKTLTKALAFALGSLFSLAAMAAPVGSILNISGIATVQQGSKVKVLTKKSEIENGDILETKDRSFLEIKFVDGTRLTLRPNSRIRVDNYSFKEEEPQGDTMKYSLIKGGLKSVTGLIGKRGNQDAYQLKTSTATIGIRGTSFGVDDCLNVSCKKPGSNEALTPGIYTYVQLGEIVMTTEQGTAAFKAGDFGFVGSKDELPKAVTNPGLVLRPPSSFEVPGGAMGGQGAAECVVR